MMIDEFKLIREKIIQDKYKNDIAIETETEFVSEICSIRSSEFYSAGHSGLKPEFMIKISACDYEGERIVEYKGIRYSIYRTYTDGDMIELYAAQKVGV